MLDAYGHLDWTVGNEDWLACFDAEIVADKIVYEVVVDCESGGFVDTIERGEIPFDKVSSLYGLPDYYADICREHYAGEKGRQYRVRVRDTARTRKAWAAHLDSLVKQGPTPCDDTNPCGECDDCRDAAAQEWEDTPYYFNRYIAGDR